MWSISQMVAAPGAEDVLRHCGGLRTVLTAIGFDFRLALPRDGRSLSCETAKQQQQPADGAAAACTTVVVEGAEQPAGAVASRGEESPNAAAVPDSGGAEPSRAASGAAVAGSKAAPEPAPPPASAAQHAAQAAALPAADSLLFRLDDYEQVCTQALSVTRSRTNDADSHESHPEVDAVSQDMTALRIHSVSPSHPAQTS